MSRSLKPDEHTQTGPRPLNLSRPLAGTGDETGDDALAGDAGSCATAAPAQKTSTDNVREAVRRMIGCLVGSCTLQGILRASTALGSKTGR
jgi:hypothetical protein